MENDECTPVSVSRRIDAPAADIFAILSDPARHREIDGSRMLQPGGSDQALSGVGDVFVTRMHTDSLGEYEMHNRVVAFEAGTCIAWEPASPEGSRNGSRWRFDLTPDGPNATVVTETYDCSDATERVRKLVDDGNAWSSAMTKTLERLDTLSTAAS